MEGDLGMEVKEVRDMLVSRKGRPEDGNEEYTRESSKRWMIPRLQGIPLYEASCVEKVDGFVRRPDDCINANVPGYPC